MVEGVGGVPRHRTLGNLTAKRGSLTKKNNKKSDFQT
jgi:hypothetical protein